MFADLDVDLVELAPFVPAAAAPLREVAFRPDAWLPAEIEKLRAMFGADEALEAIAAALGRPLAGVSTKLYDLGLRRNSRRPWTDMEDAVLLRRHGSEPAATIAADLGRSPSAVQARCGILGLTEGNPPAYSGWEDAQIRAGYERGVPVGQIATLIGRPFSGLIGRAVRLGLHHASKPAEWSNDEMARALELAHEGHRYPAIIEMLVEEGYPRRSHIGFGMRLRKLGYGRGWGRPWTPDEDELLRRAYQDGASLTPLRGILGRSKHSIRWRAGEIGLQGTHVNKAGWRQDPPWSEADLRLLREKYGKVHSAQLAAELGRTWAAVCSRANEIGLVHGYCRAFSADEHRAIAIAWCEGLGLTDLAEAMDRDPAVIFRRAKRSGLNFSDPARPKKAPRTKRDSRRSTPWTVAEILAIEDGPAAAPIETRKRPRRGAWQPRPSRLDRILQRRIRVPARGRGRR